jgi:outer membrane protein
MRQTVTLLFILLLVAIGQVDAQQKWNLETCVTYAMKHNIAVKQSVLQAKLSGITYKQSQWSQVPSLSLGTNGAFNSGNNQDPTTFTRVTQNYISAGVQLQ